MISRNNRIEWIEQKDHVWVVCLKIVNKLWACLLCFLFINPSCNTQCFNRDLIIERWSNKTFYRIVRQSTTLSESIENIKEDTYIWNVDVHYGGARIPYCKPWVYKMNLVFSEWQNCLGNN